MNKKGFDFITNFTTEGFDFRAKPKARRLFFSVGTVSPSSLRLISQQPILHLHARPRFLFLFSFTIALIPSFIFVCVFFQNCECSVRSSLVAVAFRGSIRTYELLKMKNGEFTFESQRGRGKNKCFWTAEEIKALVEALQELSYDPLWKTEGGFKQNYMFELHGIILSKIPNFKKKVDPHIESKVKWLKCRYSAISKMLGQSGCRWNAAESMISCERQWYDNWVKTHKEAKGLWNMKFPYLDSLEVVYSLECLDKVNGDAVEGFDDAFKSMEAADTEANGLELSDEGDEGENSVTHETDRNTTSTSTSRKQKKQTSPTARESKRVKTSVAPAPASFPAIEQFEMITEKFESILDSFARIATAMANKDKRAQLIADRSSNVVKELLKLGLSNVDVFNAADIFCAESHKLNVFFQLPLHMRRQYVNNLLYPASSSYVLATKRS